MSCRTVSCHRWTSAGIDTSRASRGSVLRLVAHGSLSGPGRDGEAAVGKQAAIVLRRRSPASKHSAAAPGPGQCWTPRSTPVARRSACAGMPP